MTMTEISQWLGTAETRDFNGFLVDATEIVDSQKVETTYRIIGLDIYYREIYAEPPGGGPISDRFVMDASFAENLSNPRLPNGGYRKTSKTIVTLEKARDRRLPE